MPYTIEEVMRKLGITVETLPDEVSKLLKDIEAKWHGKATSDLASIKYVYRVANASPDFMKSRYVEGVKRKFGIAPKEDVVSRYESGIKPIFGNLDKAAELDKIRKEKVEEAHKLNAWKIGYGIGMFGKLPKA